MKRAYFESLGMKAPLAATIFLGFTLIAGAQPRADAAEPTTERSGPDATQKEVRNWISLHTAEAAFDAATREMGDRRNPNQVHLIRIFAVSAEALDKLITKRPDLKPEADALYTKFDAELAPFISNGSPLQPLQPRPQQKIIQVLYVEFSILGEILKQHHELAPESDVVFMHHRAFLQSDQSYR